MQTTPDPLLTDDPEALTDEQRTLAREWLRQKYPARGDKDYIIVFSRAHPDDTVPRR